MKALPAVPSLAMLRAFEAFGRAGGTRKAAQLLELHHAVVSRHLSALESFVGTALIDRSTGTHSLTADGAEYHRRISAALQEISNATLMLRKRNDQQLLVWCSPGLAYHWLSRRLSNFSLAHPDISLELRPMDYAPDMSINEADADIRYVRHDADATPSLACRWVELAAPPIYPVASPSFAADIAARLRSADDLLTMPLLHEESDLEWRLWLESQGVKPPASTIAGPRLWHAHVLLDAATSGQGIALTNDFLAHTERLNGRLVALQATQTPFKPVLLGSYRFAARADRWHSNALAIFRNWLTKAAKS